MQNKYVYFIIIYTRLIGAKHLLTKFLKLRSTSMQQPSFLLPLHPLRLFAFALEEPGEPGWLLVV